MESEPMNARAKSPRVWLLTSLFEIASPSLPLLCLNSNLRHGSVQDFIVAVLVRSGSWQQGEVVRDVLRKL